MSRTKKPARTARAGCAAMAACAILAVAHAAAAQTAAGDADTDRAKGLYAAGASAYAAGNFGAAVQALSQAYAIAPRSTVLFSLAQAERQLYTIERRVSLLRDAISHYRTYVQETPLGGRRTDAVEVLGELESEAAHLATDSGKTEAAHAAPTRLMISAQATGALVAIDGVEHEESPVIEETRPGPHVVVTRAPGYFEDTRTVTSIEGSLVAIDVTLQERPARLALNLDDGTEAVLDGKSIGTAPIQTLEIPAGTHLVGFSRVGRVPELKTFTAQRGGAVSFTVALPLTTQRQVSYGVLGAGGLALASGLVATVVTLVAQGDALGVRSAAAQGNISQAQLDSYNDAVDRRDGWRTAAFVSFGAGSVLVLVGALLYGVDHQQPVDGVDRVGAGTRRVGANLHGIAFSF